MYQETHFQPNYEYVLLQLCHPILINVTSFRFKDKLNLNEKYGANCSRVFYFFLTTKGDVFSVKLQEEFSNEIYSHSCQINL